VFQEASVKEHPSIVPALILIAVGLFFLLNNAGLLQDVDLEKLWPGFLLLAGVAFWLQYLFGGDRDPGLVFVGTLATLLGLFFFLFTLEVELPWEFENLSGPMKWDDNAVLWPVYPLVVGIGLLVLSIFDQDWGAFGVGLVAVVVGVFALIFTLGRPDGLEELAQFWPILLIIFGIGLLLRPLFARLRA
jgi:hypothetical protein